MIKKIIKFPMTSLRSVCREVDFPLNEDTLGHIQDLKDTLASLPHGVALASNQIRQEGLRVFVVRPDNSELPQVIINPKWEPVKEDCPRLMREGCLSVPELNTEVKRYESVHLTGFTPDNKAKDEFYFGLDAQIVQHECEHLDGKLIYDHIDKDKQTQVRIAAIRNRKMGR